MTDLSHQQRLVAVMAKCIQANPSIVIANGAPTRPNAEPILRPVTLADVLLAIKYGYGAQYHKDGDWFWLGIEPGKGFNWNLRQDSLDQQSEDTIRFLHDLLCV